MSLVELENSLTVVGGRPATGKTSFAVNVASSFIRSDDRVYYWHAEGAELIDHTKYGARHPNDLLKLKVETDLFSATASISEWMKGFEHSSTDRILIVIDVVDFFSESVSEILNLLKYHQEKSKLTLLILSLIPRFLESKTSDHAEEYLRKHLELDVRATVKILGEFAGEI